MRNFAGPLGNPSQGFGKMIEFNTDNKCSNAKYIHVQIERGRMGKH